MPSAPAGRAGVRRTRIVALVAGLIAGAGLSVVAFAVTHQGHAPQPPSAIGAPGGAARRPAGSRGPVLPASPPVALSIPVIGVRSPLLRLGLTGTGALEVPAPGPHYNEAGWYRYSPTPGELGPAVIAGHVDSAAEGPSVFFRLGSLRPHDQVLVTRADGSVAIFAVDDVHRYPKARFPTQLVYGNVDRAELRLITCGGAFDRAARSYLDNIVVNASLVGSRPARPGA